MSNFINDTFDHIYCLNLKRRPDRWKDVQFQFKLHGINAERFGAIDGKTLPRPVDVTTDKRASEVACSLSHISILKHALEHNYNEILVFEDDAVLHPEFNSKFEEYYKQLPKCWEFCYVGGNYNINTGAYRDDSIFYPISSNVDRCKCVYTTVGYFLKRDFIQVLLDAVEGDNFGLAVDQVYITLQSKRVMYMFHPRLVYQKADYSDIRGGNRSYNEMKDF